MVGYLAGTTALLAYFGVAGYRNGTLTTLVMVAGGTAVISWIVQDADDVRRGYVSLLATVIAIAAVGLLTVTSPPSKGRLHETMQSIAPPGQLLSETERGHSTCRPRCPELTRAATMTLSPDLAVATVLALIQHAGFELPASSAPFTQGRLEQVTARAGKIDVVVSARATGRGSTLVVTLRSRRR